MTQALDTVLAAIDNGLETSMEKLGEVLRFASIATDPAYAKDCQKAAEWMQDYFRAMGFATQIYPTTGQPVVIANYEPPGLGTSPAAQVPHILFYGHYDVQPADPLELWTSPPFEPRKGTSKSGRPCIYARGVADDKGQLMTFTEASRLWLEAHGKLPFRLTILIEGDEEGDSSHLERFIIANKALLAADVAVVCDTGVWDDDIPAIVTSLRGCVTDEVTITGPSKDLHSGLYGGAAHNPLKVLSGILGRMFDDNGHIAIPGFYDGVKTPSAKERAAMARIPFSVKDYLGGVGLKKPAGEKAFSAVEQMWVRPTAEINGIWGGYIGEGSKTVIPSEAHAKLTFRIVAGQKPVNVKKSFRSFISKNLPKGCKVKFGGADIDSAAVSVSNDSPWISAAARALKAEWGKPAILAGVGGSIPVVENFKRHLSLDSVMVGFVRDDDGLHSPNEKYDIECYHKGMRSYARFIAEIAKGQQQ